MAEHRYTPNGLRIYTDFFDTYGRVVRVRQSSSATEDRVWLDVGEDEGHLNADQARQVIAGLSEWLAEVRPEALDEHYPAEPDPMAGLKTLLEGTGSCPHLAAIKAGTTVYVTLMGGIVCEACARPEAEVRRG